MSNLGKFGSLSDGLPGLRAARKVGRSVLLPNREALAKLTGGSTEAKSINNFAKATPSGRNALGLPDIIAMGEKGTKV